MTYSHLANLMALRKRPAGRAPAMFQKWRHLLFLHWQYDAQLIQKTLPKGLYVDTFEGNAYLGVVPFFMEDVHPYYLPSVPGISNFQEMNLRTYVYDDKGIPGVWFYSLDANQWLAVQVAKKFFHLPYVYSKMSATIDNRTSEVNYFAHRPGVDHSLASHFCYRRASAIRQAQPGSLEFFLVERYLLFAYAPASQQIFTGKVHHRPYDIAEAQVTSWDDNLIALGGFEPRGCAPDNILMSPGGEVDIFGLELNV